jgi:hypothetical protein
VLINGWLAMAKALMTVASARPAEPSFLELFTPKLVTILPERYRLADFKANVIAGLTVAIVSAAALDGDRNRIRGHP